MINALIGIGLIPENLPSDGSAVPNMASHINAAGVTPGMEVQRLLITMESVSTMATCALKGVMQCNSFCPARPALPPIFPHELPFRQDVAFHGSNDLILGCTRRQIKPASRA